MVGPMSPALPGEVNHIRRIVLACERDMEDFTAAMDAVNVDLDEMRARVDATHSIITSRQRVEAQGRGKGQGTPSGWGGDGLGADGC
eukprot:Skav230513  [mRNA]  locus=scaffold4943:21727:21987:+ [translate_table: standard]